MKVDSKPVDSKKRKLIDSVRIGCGIEIFWPLDKAWYGGVVELVEKRTGRVRVAYDDGEGELLDLEREDFRIVSYPDEDLEHPKKRAKTQDTMPNIDLPSLVGKRIEMFWAEDNAWYRGRITGIVKPETGVVRVEYEDGDVEVLRVQSHKFRVLD